MTDPHPPPPSLPTIAERDAVAPPDRARCVRLYCRVIDNFGDAGVAWRLARQLAVERGCAVTLVIDAPEALARLLGRDEGPRLLADLADGHGQATVRHVSIETWPGQITGGLPAGTDRVIAAFGCELPSAVRAALAPADPAPPGWINLEYLSAEAWVDDTHGLPSIKPSDGAIEWFVMPGFSARTGGLLRERGLFAERDAFLRDAAGPAWLARLGVPDAGAALRVSLFCYPHAPVTAMLEQAARAAQPSQWLIPEGVAQAAVQAFAGRAPGPGEVHRHGAVQLVGLPWLAQPDYDRLLWSCDLNVVRGEDSWVRAVWAARPFIWQPYRQDGDTHRVKLDAFLARLLDGAPADEAAVLHRVHHRWLDGTQDDPARRLAPADWQALAASARSPSLHRHLRDFAERTARVPDLASTVLTIADHRDARGSGPSTAATSIG